MAERPCLYLVLRPEKKQTVIPRSLVSIQYHEETQPHTPRARISNPVSGAKYSLIHLTILRRLPGPV